MIEKLRARYRNLKTMWADYVQRVQGFSALKNSPEFIRLSDSTKDGINSHLRGVGALSASVNEATRQAEKILYPVSDSFGAIITIAVISSALALVAGASVYVARSLKQAKEIELQIYQELGPVAGPIIGVAKSTAKAGAGLGLMMAAVLALILFLRKGK